MTRKSRTKHDENSFPESLWYRHESYSVAGGAIRPVRGARLIEYNPWDEYRKTMRQRRTVTTPYSAFLELGRKLQPFLLTKGFSPALEREITHWCSEWGYPGLLPASMVEVTLRPMTAAESRKHTAGDCNRERSGEDQRHGPSEAESGDEDLLFQTRYYRSGGGWGSTTDQFTPPLGKPAAHSVLFWHWYDRRWKSLDDRALTRFFPGFEDVHQQYPDPASAQFRQLYAEPVFDFARICVSFFKAGQNISDYLRGKLKIDEENDEFAWFPVDQSMSLLSSLENGLGPWHHLEAGKLTIRNEAVSLVSSFARMLLLDFSRGRRVISCAQCVTIFVSDDIRALYCSAKCRLLAATRRFRALHGPPPRVKKTLRKSSRRPIKN